MNETNKLEEWLNSNSNNNVFELTDTLNDLKENKTTLAKIFTFLEPYLTSKEAPKRSKCMKLISNLINQLPQNYLNHLEIEHITTYMCSRLEDHYTVSTAALPGLQAMLVKHLTPAFYSSDKNDLNRVSRDKTLEIIKSILREIHVQSLVQSDRFIIFSICHYVLSSGPHVEMIKNEKYDTDFVYGFIQSMDGEKDPRNLVICFECIQLICQKFRLGPFVEETFEIFACYFPIDFTPPKNENFLITKEMLIKALRNCFSASKQFSKFAVRLFLEKLNSSIEEAQLDSLETFTQCSRLSYNPNDYQEYIESLWNSFHKLVVNSNKSQIIDAALEAIQGMSQSIASNLQTSETSEKSTSNFISIEWLVKKAFENCLPSLNEMEDMKLVWPNVRCLEAIASSNSTANLLVIAKIVPLMIEKYKICNLVNQKKTCLEILWRFIGEALKFNKKAPKVVKENIESLIDLCQTNESNKTLRLQVLNGFYCLLNFDDKDLIKNYESISTLLWHSIWQQQENNDNQDQDEKNRIIEIFYYLISKCDQIFKTLFDSLSESILNQSSTNALNFIEKLFLTSLKHQDQNQNALVEKIEFECFKMLKIKLDDNYDLQFLANILDTIKVFIQNFKNNNQNQANFEILYQVIVEKLLNFAVLNKNNNYLDDSIVEKCSFVFREFSLKINSNDKYAQDFMDKVSFYFICGQSENFMPFEIESPYEQKIKLKIFLQILCSLEKTLFKDQIQGAFSAIESKLRNLAIELSSNENDEKKQENINKMAAQFYGALINKLEELDGEEIEFIEKYLIKQIEASNQNDIKRRIRCLYMWIWITKGLVLRQHSLFEAFVNKLVEWLEDKQIGRECAQAFEIILYQSSDQQIENTSNYLMNHKSAAHIKLFYRQRLFNFVHMKLLDRFNILNDMDIKLNYAISMLNLINWLPKEMIHKNLESMLPIIIFALSANLNYDFQESVCVLSLKSFELILNTETIQKNENGLNGYFTSCVGEILNKLTSMCKYEKNMDIRLLALKCLNEISCSFPPNKIIQYQRFVCRNLETCLNDKKRLCRQKAVEARNRWYLLTTKNIEN